MKKTSKLLAMLLALSLAITACGGGKEGSSTAQESGSAAEPTSESVAEESSAPAEGVAEVEKMTDANTLVVGVPDLNGDFIQGFTNSSYDVDIRRLLGTYDDTDLSYLTYYPDEGGEFQWHPTVNASEPVRTQNEDGTVTYTFTLNPELKWSDGQPLTAKDFVLNSLYYASPAWNATGASNANTGDKLKGYKAYHAGETKSFSGVRLLSDTSFSLTLDKEFVPYFYETSAVSTFPVPLHRFAPNLDVVDSEEGAQIVVKEGYVITDEDKASLVENQKKKVEQAKQAFEAELKSTNKDGTPVYDEAAFQDIAAKLDALSEEERAAALKEKKLADGTDISNYLSLYQLAQEQKAEEATLASYENDANEMDPFELLMAESALDVSQVYRFKPDVTCGPYKFVSFENNMAKVTINDQFLGNKDGKKPTIQNVISQKVNTNLAVDLLQAGTIDISEGNIEGEKIEKVKELSQKEDGVQYISYFRNGYGFLSMVCDQGPTQYKGVRQAVAYSLARDEFVQTICGGYGTVVQGPYGLDMWEVKAMEEKNPDWESELTTYTLNAEAANKALDTTPYKFEKDGTTPFDPKKAADAYNADKQNFDYWRYDDQGNQLTVYHEASENNQVSDLIATQLPDNAKLCGMNYIVNMTDFSTLLTHYTTPDKNDPQAPVAFNLAVSFSIPNVPYYQWHSSQIGNDNKCRIGDPEIDPVLEKMMKSDPADRSAWESGFETFVKWWNENVPQVPLYSNEYFDFHTARVQGMETSTLWSWSKDICDMSLAK